MKVKELVKILKELPQELNVHLDYVDYPAVTGAHQENSEPVEHFGPKSVVIIESE